MSQDQRVVGMMDHTTQFTSIYIVIQQK